jgi:23S rRNA (uracil1939-C5)-methyltransferase
VAAKVRSQQEMLREQLKVGVPGAEQEPQLGLSPGSRVPACASKVECMGRTGPIGPNVRAELQFAASQMETGQEFELQLTQAAHGGECIGRHEGKVVFVPFGIPGERVRVRLVEQRRSYARAALLEVLEPSPHRVQPPCPYYGQCGGCHWQHVSYQHQLDIKLAVVADQFRRLARLEEVPLEGIVPADEPWAYRNHIQLHPAGAMAEGVVQLGFVALDGQRVLPVAECLLAHPLVWELHQALELSFGALERVSLRAGINTGEQLVLLESSTEEQPLICLDMEASLCQLTPSGRLYTLVGRSHLHELLNGRRYRISAPSFFQVNTHQAEKLLEVVTSFADIGAGECVLDLFAGVGTFSLAFAERGARVAAVELSPWAAQDAGANLAAYGNATVLEADATEALRSLPGTFESVVVDPPRAGCGEELCGLLAALRPARLVYVSCDPATLARDTAYLLRSGLALERLLALDMFPQTAHVEVVALFCAGAGAS